MSKKFLFPADTSLFILLLVILVTWLLPSCSKKNDNNSETGAFTYGITGIEPGMASSGDTILIYGVGFSTTPAGNAVTIHGVAAKVTSATATALQVIVPTAPGQGTVEIKTGSQSNTYTGQFILATIITGQQNTSATWTPDKLYVMENKVEFLKGTTLTVMPGTIILGDRDSLASLVIDDGATLSMQGTAANPIVFSSVEAIGLRYPGDWAGITLAASSNPAADSDRISYVRIEFAGNHPSNLPGAALEIDRTIPAGNIQYVQTSYSAGDGFRFAGGTGTTIYGNYLMAFGDAGNDFSVQNGARVIGQFWLGLKDPNYADQLGSDGLLVQSSQPATISNLSLAGYDGLGRNAIYQPQGSYGLAGFVLNANSGRGIHIGGVPPGSTSGTSVNGTLQLFNSMVAAPWLAGVSFDGPLAWAGYENGPSGSAIRTTSFTYSTGTNTQNNRIAFPPQVGYLFEAENLTAPHSGFELVDTGIQYTTFADYNDSVVMQLAVLYAGTPIIDALGINNMANYTLMNGPIMSLNIGSPLLTGADFSDPRLGDPFFSSSTTFTGAFGMVDWTRGWSNYLPFTTSYQ